MIPGVPRITPAHCFLLALEAMKWPSEIHQCSEKCMYFQTTVVCAFSEGAFGKILALIRCPKTSLIRNIFS